MGDLYDICGQEYARLRPKFEEFAGVDISDVQLVEVDDFIALLEAKGQITSVVRMELSTSPYRYVQKHWYNMAHDAIVVNEFRMRYQGLNPSHVMAHELAHAAHLAMGNKNLKQIEDTKVWIAFTEGFAVYLQTDCIPDLGEELRRYSDEMRDALLLAHETRELNERVKNFNNPRYKIDGYAFFCSAVELTGSKDILFDISANPPLTMEEIRNPEMYLSRVMADG